MLNLLLLGLLGSESYGIVSASNTTSYSRKQLESIYPGFGDRWIFYLNFRGDVVVGHFKHEDAKMLIFRYDFEKNVYFTLYTRSLKNGIVIYNTTDLNLTIFDEKKKTKFITHGWMSKSTADTCLQIKNGFLQQEDVNVFIMDWHAIAGNVLYPVPAKAVISIAEYFALFLNELITHRGVNPKDLHLVGHSLGAHIMGLAAKRVNGEKIGRVTGLDPALPGFDGIFQLERISSDHADFVDLIHTCSGFLGIGDPIGHADFYPNGGKPPQPGCSILQVIEACSHGRSWKYFADSLLYPTRPFLAVSCDFGKCHNETIPMGANCPTTARGKYYLKTNDREPYALGNSGLL